MAPCPALSAYPGSWQIFRRRYGRFQSEPAARSMGYGRVVPCVDGSVLARTFFTSQFWSEQPCVRPIDAARMTAGHNALRGSGPGQKPALDSAVALVVVPISGSTGSALRAVRPSNLRITQADRRDLAHAARAAGSFWRSPLAIMAHAMRAILLASAMAATLVGRRANGAVSHGRCLVPWSFA